MRKMYQGILCIIVGLAFLMSLWVQSNYFLVGGVQEVVIEGTKHTNIMHPHPGHIPVPIGYFLIIGGIGLIIFGILRLLQVFLMKPNSKINRLFGLEW